MERKCSSIYSMGVCSYLVFSSLVLAHLFRRETWTCKQRGACTGTLLSPLGELARAHAQDSAVSTGSQAALGWRPWHRSRGRDWQNPWGPRHRGTGGAALHEVAHAVLQQESAAPVCSSSEAKDPSFSMAGFNMQLKFLYLQFAAGFKIKPS